MKHFHTVIVASLSLLLLTLSVSPQTVPRKFYNHEVVAASTSNMIVYEGPSINDFGDVAFSGKNSNTPAVFLGKVGQPTIQYFTGGSSAFDAVARQVHLNNSGHVLTNFFTFAGSARHYLRRITAVETSTILASSDPSFNDFSSILDNSFAMNGDGESVFIAQTGTGTPTLRTGERPVFSSLSPATGILTAPAISDFGDIVARAGSTTGSPLRLYNYSFGTPTIIASAADGFTSIGQSPGISTYFANVIVFYGVLNQAGADAIGTNPGPGIFASIEVDKKKKSRRIVRLTGRLIEDNAASGGNDDGVCDGGETCIQGELGFNQAGNPIFFSGYDSLSRVAVAHQSVGAAGIEDDIFVVSFAAAPNIANDRPERPFSNQFGIWTITTQIKRIGGVLKEQVAVALPVVQYGDVIDGRTITELGVYDQIASVRDTPSTNDIPGGHRLAFYAGSNTGNMIIRANQIIEPPVIFIPGILGSRLSEVSGSTQTERWPGLNLFLLSNLNRLPPSANANIVATDVIRYLLPGNLKPVYGPLLETLSGAGLVEYQVDGKPERREFQGCDIAQKINSPRLFVFAYDWRKSNAENVGKLKEYVQCIQRIYPSTKVDLIAHSMGGLLGRRYIISNPGNHSVRKFISIGSPFLGATEALQVAETGRPKMLDGILSRRVPRQLGPDVIRRIAQESAAVHELFPSAGYFSLGGRPLAEKTFDINGDGAVPQVYEYFDTFDFYNSRFLGSVYSTNQAFHGFTGQDDWRMDSSNVEYHQLFGVQNRRRTIEKLIAERKARRPISLTRFDFSFRAERGAGDGTVPRLSAERCQTFGCASGTNFNVPNGTLVGYFAESEAQNSLYEHLGLVSAPEVQTRIFNTLDLDSARSPLSRTTKVKNMEVVIMDKGVHKAATEPPMAESYYVSVVGTERLEITDHLGNTNTPIGDAGFELSVPGVGYSGGIYSEPVHIGYHDLDLPANEGSYTIKFRTGSDSIDIEVLKGTDNTSPNLAVRYIDLDLPPNVDCIMTFNPQGVPDLAYDSNGDGTFDTVVPAHVRVSGTAAQDVTAPAVTLTYSKRTGSGRVITINASDTESGVKTVYYRVGETGNFKIYEGQFHVSVITGKVIEAFADDNVGNRSSPIRVVVPDFHTR